MPISLSVTRPKLVGTVSVTPDIIAKPLVEGASFYEVPICLDNLTTTPVALSDIDFTTGSPTITGLSAELAKVKIGSIIVTAGGTSDFATGTYVTAKPTPTTLTVSTNALTTLEETTATATLTVDATIGILRVNISSVDGNIRISPVCHIMDGSKATDSNGNGYDEVVIGDGSPRVLGSVDINFDSFATNFGLLRTNS